MSQDFKIQQNVKVGNDLVNLRGDNPDEFQRVAEWTLANAALFVNVAAALNAVPPALAGNVTSTQVIPEPTAPPAPPQGQPAWGAPQQQAPQWSQPATGAPSCAHGEMVWKDFTSKAGNAVKGHFCPSNDRNNSCPPKYAPKGR